MNLVDVNEGNVADVGFFCMMSKKKTPGYQKKLEWLKARFAEGMRIKLLDLAEGGRGFIEYLPAEYAWRPVEAKGYLFVHCLWVVGKCKGKGYGTLLLDACIEDARRSGMKGVAMIASEKAWLVKRPFLERYGFESVDRGPPAFDLMALRFGKATPPAFSGDWDEKIARCGSGLTILHTAQCPYNDDAVKILVDAAAEQGMKAKTVELKDCQSVRERSPSPYGVFGVVCNGTLMGYHYLTKKDFLKRLQEVER